jgi:hypothetical protein
VMQSSNDSSGPRLLHLIQRDRVVGPKPSPGFFHRFPILVDAERRIANQNIWRLVYNRLSLWGMGVVDREDEKVRSLDTYSRKHLQLLGLAPWKTPGPIEACHFPRVFPIVRVARSHQKAERRPTELLALGKWPA